MRTIMDNYNHLMPTIAAAYRGAESFPNRWGRQWEYFADENAKLYNKLQFAVIPVRGQPYTNTRQMRDSILIDGLLKVSTDYIKHPIWDKETQIEFRAVHDFHHVLSEGDFDWDGEWAACV